MLKNINIWFFILILFGCSLNKSTTQIIEGEGEKVQKEFAVDMFRYLEIDVNANIQLIQSDSLSVSIDGYKNIVDLLDFRVSNSHMLIKLKKSSNHNSVLNIKIYVPAIQRITMNGTGNLEVKAWENEERLYLRNNGSSKFTLSNLKNIKHLIIELNGGGNIESLGDSQHINTLHCTLNGSGNVYLKQINSSYASIESNGSGNVDIGLSEILNTTIIGSGNISYQGFPKIHQKIIGSGTIIQK